ncbi:MAG: hypothetical protein AAF724_01720 [Pseudomonadota bacterium]
MSDPRDTLRSRRKQRDRSMVLVLVGIALFVPPIVGVSQIDAKIGGVPVPLLFVFGAWALLIVAAFFLADRLSDGEPPSAEAKPNGGED